MRCKDIIELLEDWAPKETGWQKDNSGLQIGSRAREVKNLLLCLDLTPKVLEEAIRKKCNFIISHHPFIFTPIRNIDQDNDEKGKMIETLIKNDITLYSAHTNLDFAKDGVSFQLAKVLGLKDPTFLHNQESNHNKFSVFVPTTHLEVVADAAFNAGAGIIGEYSNCSFRVEGTGTFKGSVKSNPAIGKKEKLEQVQETKLEFTVEKWNVNKVLRAVKKAHPYEELAYEVSPLLNADVNRGEGVIGELAEGLKVEEFFDYISKRLKIKNFRYSKGISKTIKKVAVCGGAGKDLLSAAIGKKADAFITADVKYHDFQAADGKILFIDAGHYETEVPVLDELQKRISKLINNSNIRVYKYAGSTNPINFYKNKGAR